VFPVSDAGRVVAFIISLLGITAIGLPAGIFTTGLLDVYRADLRAKNTCPHCGKSPSEQSL